MDSRVAGFSCESSDMLSRGETTHYILRVASAPSTTAVTDSLDFQVADASLQIQLASAKCVRCASLRSGGRRLAVRKMIECHISAQPRTPFCHYVAFPLKGKREIWREKQGVIYFMYHSGVSPFGGWRHHLPPHKRWDYGCLAMEPCLFRKA